MFVSPRFSLCVSPGCLLERKPTIALANIPLGKLLQQILRKLNPQRRRPAKDEAHGAQVVLVRLLAREQLDQQRGHDVELLELEALDRDEELGEVKLGQDDDLVAAVLAEEGVHGEAVDVAEREEAEGDLGVDVLRATGGGIVEGGLNDVGHDVLVGDHDCFLIGD